MRGHKQKKGPHNSSIHGDSCLPSLVIFYKKEGGWGVADAEGLILSLIINSERSANNSIFGAVLFKLEYLTPQSF